MDSIIFASISLLASVVTASLSYYFTKKQQLKMEERRLKEEYFKKFLKALSDVAINNKNEEALNRLSEGFNYLLLIANVEVVEKLMDFHNFIKITNTSIPRDSDEWTKKHDILLRELIKSMRHDLFGRDDKSESFPEVHLSGGKSAKR